MFEEITDELYLAIKKDDLKSFEKHLKDEGAITISFGRFPILSLCYLFNSRKIIKKYEDRLLSIRNFIRIDEKIETYTLFKQKAGRIIRVYAGKDIIVHPLEMLAILNKAARLENVYPKAIKTNQQIENIKLIEQIKQSKDVEASETKIKMPRQPLDKKVLRFGIASMAVLLILALVFVGFSMFVYSKGNGTETRPYKIVSYKQLAKAIESNSYIVLEKDVEVDSLSFGDYSGTIDGNGHTITLTNQTSNIFKEVSGEIKNLTIKATVDAEPNVSFGLLSTKLTGKIDNVNLEVTGQIKYVGSDEKNFISLSLYTILNQGTISNSKINGSIAAKGNDVSAVIYCAICGENASTITNIENNCEANVEDASASGGTYKNNGTISSVTNNGNITLTSDDANGSFALGGVAIVHNGTIKDAINNGKLEVAYSNEIGSYAYIAGIAVTSNGSIEHSKNAGELICNAKYAAVYAGGISATGEKTYITYPTFNKCASLGKITINVENAASYAYVGGIMGVYDLTGIRIDNCYSVAKVDISGIAESRLLVGGISGIWPDSTAMSNNAYLQTGNTQYGIYVYVNMFVGYQGYERYDGMFEGYSDKAQIEALEIYW